MEDGSGQQRGAGLDPVIVESACRRDRRSSGRCSARPRLRARCASRTCSSGLYLTLAPVVSVGSNLRQICPMALARAGGELPVLALEIVDQSRMRPGEQGRNYHADALAAARRRHHQHMARTAIAQIRSVARRRDRSRPPPRVALSNPTRTSQPPQRPRQGTQAGAMKPADRTSRVVAQCAEPCRSEFART